MASVAVFLFSFGCASTPLPRIPAGAAGVTTHIETGTVVETRTVKIDGTSSNIGIYGGGVVGSAVGSTAGRGDGRVLASAGGAVAGAIVGRAIEKAVTAKLAQEVTIELDDGRVIAVVQETKDLEFHRGDRVKLMESVGGSRVVHMGI